MEKLSLHTTMGIGGFAHRYCEVNSIQALNQALESAKAEHLPIFILGSGSNLLVADEGFCGCVIRPAFDAITWQEPMDGGPLVTAQAGAELDQLVAQSCAQNLGGIEALSGIPGSVGGALVQNAGAYGQEIADTFVSAQLMHRETGEVVTFDRNAMAFAYRSTALKTTENPWIVIEVTLQLKPFHAEEASERCTRHGFARMAQNLPKSAQALRDLVVQTRRSKAMCYDKNDFNTHSVGSFFVNPVVPNEMAQRLNAANILKNHKPMPSYPAPNGTKLSAAWLIENAGFNKGYASGAVALSQQHCLAIVNRGQATCAEVIQFAKDIAKRVYLMFRVELKPEVVFLAFNGLQSIDLEVKDAERTGVSFRPNPLFL